ncbi:hypothetical protein LVB77_18815 [Lysobacter sp. 5GHs7-4]|uniref:hypothetical protein n=1 Tax=Lysobacter sp. 5GHs7-4 TaxID=2904253 RepID=UPI001E3C27F3|nr:hypothetical protein [Lysobacter sp. 5GHs7-4]UHQ22676.1 hypothetical protein LVB77_18815 [Lysobacter sp. 5GHs7-4]
MRYFISAAIAAALLAGCSQEHTENPASSNAGSLAAKDVPTASASTGRAPAIATARTELLPFRAGGSSI